MNASSPPPGDSEIARLQRWFQSVMTHPDGVEAGAASVEAQQCFPLAADNLGEIITPSADLSPTERISIYARAYYARLLECLGEVFPVLKQTLGDELFSGFAFGYLQQYPSRSYTLHELGRHFPNFLRETRPRDDADAPWPEFLIDLAALEWGIYEVFDGPGVEKTRLLEASDLAAITPQAWSDARLQPVVCLRLLATRFPVNEYYTAKRRETEEAPAALPEPQASFVALHRRDFIVRRHSLSRTEYEILKCLQEGATISQAIVQGAARSDADEETLARHLKEWFRRWTTEGFFQSIDTPA